MNTIEQARFLTHTRTNEILRARFEVVGIREKLGILLVVYFVRILYGTDYLIIWTLHSSMILKRHFSKSEFDKRLRYKKC